MTLQGHLHQFIDLLWPSHGRFVTWCFPGGSEIKASACNARDPGSIPGSGKSPGKGNGNPLQYSCLEKSHGRRSLVGYSLPGCKELDMTEQLHFTLYFQGMSVSIEMSFYWEDVNGFGIFIGLELGWKTVGKIVLKTPVCVKKTIVELFRLEKNRWIKLQRLKPEREN